MAWCFGEITQLAITWSNGVKGGGAKHGISSLIINMYYFLKSMDHDFTDS